MSEQTNKREIKVIKRVDSDRSELSLLTILIERNFERAKVIIERIAESRKRQVA